jgi:pyruvate dehydrogenase E1 component alpha subunit
MLVIERIHSTEFSKYGLSRDKLIKLYRKMLEIRRFEEKVEELFLVKGVLVGPAHLYIGEEAVAVGVLEALRENDMIVTTHRGHGHAIAKDVPLKNLMAELFGKETGTCKGLGGSMHAAIWVKKGSIYASAIVGSGIPIAVGIAFGLKYQKKDSIVISFFGDGATNTGEFHEAMNMASLLKLPLLLVCENNLYAMSTKITDVLASKSIAERAKCYNMKSVIVDGNDAISVFVATKIAEEEIRVKRNGPIFLECRTYRQKGHGVYDKALYRPKEEVEEWIKKDPIRNLYDRLIREEFASEDELKSIDIEVRKEVEEAVKFAMNSKVLDFSKLWDLVYAR